MEKIESIKKILVDNNALPIDEVKNGVINKANNGVVVDQYKAFDNLTENEKNLIKNWNELEFVQSKIENNDLAFNFKIESVKITNNKDNENQRAFLKVFSYNLKTIEYKFDYIIDFLANMDLDYTEDNKKYIQLYDWFDYDYQEKRLQKNLKLISENVLKVFNINELPENDNILLFDSNINNYDGIQLTFDNYFIEINGNYDGSSLVEFGVNDEVMNKLTHISDKYVYSEGTMVDQLRQAKNELKKVVQ